MPFLMLKFLHVGSMFLATALAVGPSVLLYRIAQGRDPTTIHRAVTQATAVYRVAAACYGLGVLFGVTAALNGAIDLTAGWLLLAYGLIVLLIVTNLTFERWTRRIDAAADVGDDRSLTDVVKSRSALVAVTAMTLFSVLIVFVMVTKPSIG